MRLSDEEHKAVQEFIKEHRGRKKMAKLVYVVGIKRGDEYWFNLSTGGNYGYATQEAAEEFAERCRQLYVAAHPEHDEEQAREFYQALPIRID